MERGLYIAASGMAAEMVRQDILANNLANASTPGYKSDRVSQRSFGSLLLSNRTTGQPVGRVALGAQIDRRVTDLAPTALRDTDRPLDFAIAGEGWFAVSTPAGTRFTRNGQFSASAQGTLVTALGAPVLGPGGTAVRVGADGRVDPRAIGVFAVPGAQKTGDNLYAGTAAGRAPGTVRAGALEGSGAEPVRAMVDMMASLRTFESGQKAITTIDETLARTASAVGSISGS